MCDINVFKDELVSKIKTFEDDIANLYKWRKQMEKTHHDVSLITTSSPADSDITIYSLSGGFPLNFEKKSEKFLFFSIAVFPRFAR